MRFAVAYYTYFFELTVHRDVNLVTLRSTCVYTVTSKTEEYTVSLV